MKNIYLLLSAACIAVSASAVEKQAIPAQNRVGASNASLMMVSPKGAAQAINPSTMKKASKATRADEVFSFYRPGSSIWALGSSVNGYGFQDMTFGFASSYGTLNFYSFCNGAESTEWSYSDLNDGDGENWNIKTAEGEKLSVKSGIGETMTPELTAVGADGTKATYAPANVREYLCGGNGTFWIGQDELEGDFGVCSYQNYGMLNPQKYSGSLTYVSAYLIGEEGFNANGVYVNEEAPNNWQSYFEDGFDGAEITNLAIDNFTFLMSAPQSTYTMTRMWGPCNITATADTQLLSYIYPLDEEGVISETPIALGYASVSAGESGWVVFEYNPLNEDGDELEGDIYIDTAVAITIEGFAGNEAITEVCPSSGYYPFSYSQYESGNTGLVTSPTMYLGFSMNVDGEPYSNIFFDRAFYYYDQSKNGDRDACTLLAYHQMCTDATFAFIHAVNGEESVNVAEAGGEETVALTAYWYDIAGLVEEGYYEVTAPEWVKVEFSEANPETLEVDMTLNVEPSETGRTGIVSIDGLGATFSLEVIQGEGGAVNAIAVERGAQYFDLSGRRVLSPEKGIYIKKSGNKAEKVIF